MEKNRQIQAERKRQIAALIATCTPEEKERIKAARKAGRAMRRRIVRLNDTLLLNLNLESFIQ
jgi:hypothetical protein